MQSQTSSLAHKIAALAPTQRAEAERFIDRLQYDPHVADTRLDTAALSEASFAVVWNNPEDDVYDAL